MLPPRLQLWFAVCAACWLALATTWGGTTPPAASLRDLEGRAIHPFKAAEVRYLVFIFLRTDCPIANVYAPEIQRLAKRWRPLGFTFHLVYGDADESTKAIRTHLAEYGYALPACRDAKDAFARQSEIKVTPEAALYRADGKLLYHGRIDDRFAGLGRARPAPTVRDLVRALEAAAAGRPVPAPGGPAVGCIIEGI